MTDKWDDEERKKFPTQKYVFKKDQFQEVLADAYAFRYLVFTIGQKIPLAELRKVCDDANKLFNVPESPDDSFQIEEFIFREMKNRGWEL